MKKKLHLILVLCFIVISVAALSACKKQELNKPTNLKVDLVGFGTVETPEPIVTWDVVEMSTGGYKVDVNGEITEVPYRIEYEVKYELDIDGEIVLDANGEPKPLLDKNGNPVLQTDKKGKPIPVVDEEGKEIPVRNNYLVLGQLEPKTEYRIKVQAITIDNNYYKNGPWSDELVYTPPDGLNLKYTSINNGTEWEIVNIGTSNESEIIIEDTHFDDGKPITSIAAGAFMSIRGVTKIYIGANIKTIGGKAFQNLSTLKEVVFAPGSKLTTIGEGAFFRATKLESLELPDGVTTIGRIAFGSTDFLKKVKLSQSLTVIPAELFSASGIEEVIFGNSLTTIGKDAFINCKKLTEIKIPDSVTSIGENAFRGASTLKKVTLGTDVEEIGPGAFLNCQALTEVKLNDKLKTIGNNAFRDCISLASISIPLSVNYVGTYSFRNSKIWNEAVKSASESLDKWKIVYVDNWAVGFVDSRPYLMDEENKVVYDANYRPIPVDSEGEPSKLDLILKEGTVGIAGAAFYNCLGLVSIEMTDVKYINQLAFLDCFSLRYIHSWDKVTTIGDSAFENCRALTRDDYNVTGELAMGNSIETIGEFAFMRSGVRTVSNISNVKVVGHKAFYETTLWQESTGLVVADNWIVGHKNDKINTITITNNIVGIANYTFYKFEELSTVAIAPVSSLKYIGEGAFRESNINGIQIPNSVISIGRSAFYECTSNVSVEIGTGVTEIEDRVFYANTSLTGVTIRGVLKSIGSYAFSQCEALRNFNFKEGLTTIDSFAFVNTRFTTLDIPASVEIIGDHAFRTCTDVVTINFAQNSKLVSIGDHALRDTWALLNINLPQGLKHIGVHAFRDAWALKTITLPDSLESISDELFRDCVHLTTVNLGNGIKHIGEYAFLNCEVLLTIEIPDSVEVISAHAFRNCASLVSVVLGPNITTIGSHVFNGNNYLTIVSKAPAIPQNAASNWNSAFRPVVWNVEIAADDNYVDSFIKNKATMQYVENNTFFYREGYAFAGWSLSQNGSVISDINQINDGTKLFANWKQLDKRQYTFMSGQANIVINDYMVFWSYDLKPEDVLNNFNYTKTVFAGWYDNQEFYGQSIDFPYYSLEDHPAVFYAKWEEAKPDGTSPHTGFQIFLDEEPLTVKFSSKHYYHFGDVSYYAVWYYFIVPESGIYTVTSASDMTVGIWTIGTGGSVSIANQLEWTSAYLTSGSKYLIGIVDTSGNMPDAGKNISIEITKEE